jgi:hypothetical protein
MMDKAKKKKNISRRIIIIAIAFILLVTGGIFIVSVDDFGAAMPYRLADGSEADVWLQPKITEVGTPLVLVYRRYTGPYSLNIRNWDGGGKYKSIHIAEITTEYGNGMTDRRAIEQSAEAKPAHDPGFRSGRSLMSVPDLIRNHADNKIGIKGWLQNGDGGKVPFETSFAFTAQHRNGLAPYWIALGLEK